MKPEARIIARADVPALRARLKAAGKSLVFTNGCFDILHEGHLTYLKSAAECGDVLMMGLNNDRSVRELKGPTRPVRREQLRAKILAEQGLLDYIVLFDERDVTNLLREVRPDLYVKGGDYHTRDSLGADVVAVLDEGGIAFKPLPLVPGVSTTAILSKLTPEEIQKLSEG
jgi:rfaE bifunctional protein nucleotidyltransferase chain/domain